MHTMCFRRISVDVAAIRRKRDLLDGICPEAVQLLKDKRASAGAFREMRKVKPMRQIEMAELMVAANNFSGSYAHRPSSGRWRSRPGHCGGHAHGDWDNQVTRSAAGTTSGKDLYGSARSVRNRDFRQVTSSADLLCPRWIS